MNADRHPCTALPYDSPLCRNYDARDTTREQDVFVARNKLRHPERHSFKVILWARRVVEQHEQGGKSNC